MLDWFCCWLGLHIPEGEDDWPEIATGTCDGCDKAIYFDGDEWRVRK